MAEKNETRNCNCKPEESSKNSPPCHCENSDTICGCPHKGGNCQHCSCQHSHK